MGRAEHLEFKRKIVNGGDNLVKKAKITLTKVTFNRA